MENKFEKLDGWMMKASRNIREQKISKTELDAFHEGVMKKVAASQSSGWKLPFPGLMMTAAFSFAVILGAAVYMHQVRVVPEEKPVKAEVKLVTAPIVPAAIGKETAEPVKTLPLTAPPASVTAVLPREIPASAPVTVVKEEDLMEEIEALKELGLWTEEDEEEAGIPIEAAFAELESFLSETQSPMPLPAAAS